MAAIGIHRAADCDEAGRPRFHRDRSRKVIGQGKPPHLVMVQISNQRLAMASGHGLTGDPHAEAAKRIAVMDQFKRSALDGERVGAGGEWFRLW